MNTLLKIESFNQLVDYVAYFRGKVYDSKSAMIADVLDLNLGKIAEGKKKIKESQEKVSAEWMRVRKLFEKQFNRYASEKDADYEKQVSFIEALNSYLFPNLRGQIQATGNNDLFNQLASIEHKFGFDEIQEIKKAYGHIGGYELDMAEIGSSHLKQFPLVEALGKKVLKILKSDERFAAFSSASVFEDAKIVYEVHGCEKGVCVTFHLPASYSFWEVKQDTVYAFFKSTIH